MIPQMGVGFNGQLRRLAQLGQAVAFAHVGLARGSVALNLPCQAVHQRVRDALLYDS
jgi:hypothetical protein